MSAVREMKRGQIWVETVIYTLIGLALIGLVLAITTPKINELKDRAVVEQTIDSLNVLDSKINEVMSAPANKRTVEFRMKRGELSFFPSEDRIVFELKDSRTLYSEPGVSILVGRVNVTTIEGAKKHLVKLELNYKNNITYDGDEVEAIFSQASVPYRFSIENTGVRDGKFVIDIKRL